MTALLIYIIAASVGISFFYLFFRVLFRKNFNPQHARIFLICSVAASLLIPLSNTQIQTGLSLFRNEPVILQIDSPVSDHSDLISLETLNQPEITTGYVIIRIYLIMAFLLIGRIIWQIVLLSVKYSRSLKVREQGFTLLYNHRFTNTFSFFRWIFVQPVFLKGDDLKQIIAHEKVHVSQFHSADLLVIELLAAVMWFNPVVWMMRKSLKLVHEYLADQGALETGIDRIRYQTLLVNQVAEESLVCLSSSFNHSIIKKRITMMTKTNIQGRSVLKLIGAVPVAIVLFTAMAVFNGMFIEAKASSEPMISPEPDNNSAFVVDEKVSPPDTIVKRTIIKRISSSNPNDTITEEKEEIITGIEAESEMRHEISHAGDKEITIIKHEPGESGESVRRYTTTVSEDEEIKEEDFGDSVRTVRIVRHSGDNGGVRRYETVRHRNDRENSHILYIVDGVEKRESNVIEKINPEDIVRIDVIKENIKKYTSEDFDGVIIITTKKGNK